MGLPRTLRPTLTPLRLTLAIALIAVASSGYVVFVARIDAPLTFEATLARASQQFPCGLSDGAQDGWVSFATASP